MTLYLPARSFVKFLYWLAASLVFAHVISLVLINQSTNQITELLIEKFSLEEEGNFPSYFSAFILFVSAGLFFIIGKAAQLKRDISWKHWFGLALIFVFLSLDEAVQIHEKLDTDLIWASIDTSGLLAWPWVILYGGLATIVLAVYFKFWLRLAPRFRTAFAIAAAVYVLSALGFEMFEALEYTTNGGITTKYIVLTSLEETFEIAAIIYLISTNFSYIAATYPDLGISFSKATQLTSV